MTQSGLNWRRGWRHSGSPLPLEGFNRPEGPVFSCCRPGIGICAPRFHTQPHFELSDFLRIARLGRRAHFEGHVVLFRGVLIRLPFFIQNMMEMVVARPTVMTKRQLSKRFSIRRPADAGRASGRLDDAGHEHKPKEYHSRPNLIHDTGSSVQRATGANRLVRIDWSFRVASLRAGSRHRNGNSRRLGETSSNLGASYTLGLVRWVRLIAHARG
jgi:hypothetical protein